MVAYPLIVPTYGAWWSDESINLIIYQHGHSIANSHLTVTPGVVAHNTTYEREENDVFSVNKWDGVEFRDRS